MEETKKDAVEGSEKSTGITKEQLTLIAAVIAAVVSLFNIFYTTFSQSRLESQKWIQARQDDADKNLRLAVADLTRKLAIGSHRMGWVTWKAVYARDSFSAEDIATYDKDMREVLPDVIAAHLLIAAMDRKTYDKIGPLAEKLYMIDGAIGQAGHDFINSKRQINSKWMELYNLCLKYQDQLKKEMTEIISAKAPI
jgi:hypothetical protein